ncbi:XRN 5'-3' exonuclease N-terminus-domain-containing protein [Hygrophoropsis aurantiaca]|uniref:XRN 5'-3' exonuclease N-terminus-domain-containing protein n=1 Tax=Hygrophoropsis aurantiaca TaxID=72124 RepID=A0ACB8AUA3_9AGAM|nr:XRN 5'-3' exonuclease N-terminus-domain-containing protein [Hygrophoropsis aurantiaca]
MGVPALFRWLSKKYPKIVLPVAEDDVVEVPDAAGDPIKLPVDITQPNPNGVEFDNLYLDMNGIVHPCTHPEGKPAPETEEDMMVEVFSYTERVVNMIRPRKLLFMAIDGVAPRAKMNQQRSRRFRSAQEAKDKAEARKIAVAEWEAMGKVISDEDRDKEAWDSNAITPGTPFMDLLAKSLRYWVVQKINSDPGWKDLQVVISDASVPGEGEHKIMDFIRRQRTNQGHDPNTNHVIYGLDADLIMLALATHEPNFRVLREDVFAQDKGNGCRICGREGHYAAQCTGLKSEIKKPPPEKKPFIFLDVSILREYLEAELNVAHTSFPFNFEQAIDDWVLLIFFVGNDFLPHLPSLEIREGAIDTLLRIWKNELPRMGGYLTNHGQLVLSRAQIILEGLARREDEIFRKRQETEQRQDQEAKRRKLERSMNTGVKNTSGPSTALGLTASTTTYTTPSSLPQRPTNDFSAKADSIGFGAPVTPQSVQNIPAAAQALAGSNRDVVANRAAIRMANMSAAEMLKAELSGLVPVKPTTSPAPSEPVPSSNSPSSESVDMTEIPGLGNVSQAALSNTDADNVDEDMDAEGDDDPNAADDEAVPIVGVKRKIEDVDAEDPAETEDLEEPEDASPSLALVVRADGTVEQEDTVRLFEPGYKERYYKQKFGIDVTDKEFRKKLITHYVEGIAWVLHYYYQGTPSWQWYYPYHFAPFASDFEEMDAMDIRFDLGQPFKPYEQLMGVFPAASRKHIPVVFQDLMTNEDSPIIDFYPPTFQIDMNGKKMAWQGVALLPFIDPKRLLEAMATRYPKLTEDEIRRNRWGNDVILVADDHKLYPFFESLYGKSKQKEKEPLIMPVKASKGISGSVLPNPDCLPGSTYYSPLSQVDLPDIKNDRSLSALYFFPKQLSPHRSLILPGVNRPPRQLTREDTDPRARRGRGGGRGMDRGGGGGGGGGGRGNSYGGPPSHGPHSRNNGYGSSNGSTYQTTSYVSSYNQQPKQSYSQQQGFGHYGSNGRPPAQNYGGGGGYQSTPRGAPPHGLPTRGEPHRSGVSGYGAPAPYGQPPYQQTPYGRGGYSGAYDGGGNGRGSTFNSGGGRGGYGGYGGYGAPPNVGHPRGAYGGGYGAQSYGNNAPRARGRGGW